MSKFVRRIIPFESCDIPAIQRWLEDMAEKGLFFKECGVFFAKFEKGEPEKMRYRLDFCDVVACDIPEEKKELYEQSGWSVVGDFKNDCVVICTDDPDAPEIYTDPEQLIKPLKKLTGKQLAYWIALILLIGLVNVGPISPVFDGRWNMINYLVEYGTLKFILDCVILLVLTAELVYHFVQWLCGKRLIKSLRNEGELPQCKRYSVQTAFGKVLTPLMVPIVIAWGIHFAGAMLAAGHGNAIGNTVHDRSNLPFPTMKELNADYVQSGNWKWIVERSDLLARRIMICDEDNSDASGDEVPRFSYYLTYYEFKSESLADSFVDGEIKSIVIPDSLTRFEFLGKTYEWDVDGNISEAEEPVLERKEYRLDGADIVNLCETGEDNAQYLLIKLNNQVVYVTYSGPDDINDFTQLYIDRLKSAKYTK